MKLEVLKNQTKAEAKKQELIKKIVDRANVKSSSTVCIGGCIANI
jgi:hypothetical protein